MKLSVVSITFNNFEELLATCESLKGQSSIEHIVINGGKCPLTLNYLKNSPHIKSISEKDQGISDAFNKGIALAKGQFIAFLNSGDTLIDQSYYLNAINVLQSDPSIDFVHSSLKYVDQYAGEVVLSPVNVLPDMPFWHPTMVVRARIFKMVGCFRLDLKSAMDLDFVYRMTAQGSKGQYIDTASVRMDGRGVSSVRPWVSLKEKIKVIILNRDYRFSTWIKIYYSLVKLVIRELLLKIGLISVLRLVKHRIYKLKYSKKI